MIKAITRYLRPDSGNIFYTVEMSHEELFSQVAMERFVYEFTAKLADKFIEDHGGAILERINNQVVDAKVIAKVVANLRKELKKP